MSDAASYWLPLINLVPRLRCWNRIGFRKNGVTLEGCWSQMLIMPVVGYLESSGEPIPLRDVEYVEVSTVRLKGRLAGLPLQLIDIKSHVLNAVRESGMAWELREVVWSIEPFFEEQTVHLVRFPKPNEITC